MPALIALAALLLALLLPVTAAASGPRDCDMTETPSCDTYEDPNGLDRPPAETVPAPAPAQPVSVAASTPKAPATPAAAAATAPVAEQATPPAPAKPAVAETAQVASAQSPATPTPEPATPPLALLMGLGLMAGLITWRFVY